MFPLRIRGLNISLLTLMAHLDVLCGTDNSEITQKNATEIKEAAWRLIWRSEVNSSHERAATRND